MDLAKIVLMWALVLAVGIAADKICKSLSDIRTVYLCIESAKIGAPPSKLCDDLAKAKP